MKAKCILMLFFIVPILLVAGDKKLPPCFHELHQKHYSEYIDHALNCGDKLLSQGNIEEARMQYESAESANSYVTMPTQSNEIRISVSRAIIKLIANKDQEAIKDFVGALLTKVEYKDGKIIIELDSLNF